MKELIERFKKRFIRKSGKVTDILPIAILESVAIVMLGSIFTLPIVELLKRTGLFDGIKASSPEAFSMASDYFQFVGIWVFVLLVILIPPANRRMIRGLLPNRRGNGFLGILVGIVLGFAFNAVCILLSVLLGDVAISFKEFNIINLLLIYGTVLIQSGAEELADRFFLYEKLRRRYKSPWVAIFVNPLVFMALHLPNPGITAVSCAQIFVVGLVFSLLVFYYDALWTAIFFHTTWNFTQNIIFGCPNSGIVSQYSIFKLDAASDGLFFNARFGVEGSVGAVVFLAVLAVFLYLFAKVRNLEEQDLWADLNVEPDDEPVLASPASSGPKHMKR